MAIIIPRYLHNLIHFLGNPTLIQQSHVTLYNITFSKPPYKDLFKMMSRIGKKSPSICMFKDKTNLNFISQSILFRFLLNFLLPVVTFEMTNQTQFILEIISP